MFPCLSVSLRYIFHSLQLYFSIVWCQDAFRMLDWNLFYFMLLNKLILSSINLKYLDWSIHKCFVMDNILQLHRRRSNWTFLFHYKYQVSVCKWLSTNHSFHTPQIFGSITHYTYHWIWNCLLTLLRCLEIIFSYKIWSSWIEKIRLCSNIKMHCIHIFMKCPFCRMV